MDRTDRHRLHYLAANQAQKHVTVNESVRMLDALVGASARSAGLAEEPGAPGAGEGYILPEGAAGASWDAFAANDYVVFQDGAWARFAPSVGLSVYVEDEGAARVWDGEAWRAQAGGTPEGAPRFGVNAAADATNRLAVKSDAVLHSHDDVTPGSGDARHVLNKAAPENTASFLFQTGFGGRAEIGLTGSDDFAFRVSPDGAAWHTAMLIDRTTGAVMLPNTQSAPSEPPVGVIPILGQSNAVGSDGNTANRAHPANTFQWTQGGEIAPATMPLDHEGAIADRIGPDYGLAEAWHAENPGGTLYFVPCAKGATAFASGDWNPGDPLYERAVARTVAALAAIRARHPGARLTMMAWHQGESDNAAAAKAGYEAAWRAMAGDFRARLGAPDLPIVLGQMTPAAIAADRREIDDAHRRLAATVPFAALASSAGLTDRGDALHFDAASYATLGRRYHAALAAARAAAPGVPGQVAGLTATPQDGALSLAWDAPAANRSAVTDYVVEVDGAVFSDGVSDEAAASVTGLTDGAAYELRVAGVNGEGQGPFSAVVRGTPGAASAPYADALGYWTLGSANVGMEEAGGARALTLRKDAVTHGEGHARLAPTNANGLVTDIDEPAAYTAWGVFRWEGDGNAKGNAILGTCVPFGQRGGGLESYSATDTRLIVRGDAVRNVAVGAKPAAGQLFFAAYAVFADRIVGYVRPAGGAAVVSEKAGPRAAPDGKLIGVGNVYRSGGNTEGLSVFEFGVLPGPRDAAGLDALYADAAARVPGLA